MSEAVEMFSWECWLRGSNTMRAGYLVNAPTRGKAKSQYWRHLDCDFEYTDIIVKKLGVVRNTDGFNRTAEMRGVPFAHCGMTVQVGKHKGVIVDKNCSANFDVYFTEGPYKGQVLNCHPHSNMKYFDCKGNEIAVAPTEELPVAIDHCIELLLAQFHAGNRHATLVIEYEPVRTPVKAWFVDKSWAVSGTGSTVDIAYPDVAVNEWGSGFWDTLLWSES